MTVSCHLLCHTNTCSCPSSWINVTPNHCKVSWLSCSYIILEHFDGSRGKDWVISKLCILDSSVISKNSVYKCHCLFFFSRQTGTSSCPLHTNTHIFLLIREAIHVIQTSTLNFILMTNKSHNVLISHFSLLHELSLPSSAILKLFLNLKTYHRE